MRTMHELLLELEADDATNVRIVSGVYRRNHDAQVAAAARLESRHALAATTASVRVERGVRRGPSGGVTMRVSREEAELLVKHGARAEVALE